MNEPTSDDFSPRELGMKLGHTWAEMAPTRAAKQSSAAAQVATVAESGAVPDDVRKLTLSGMSERLNGPDDERAFLDGFVHGVRAFVASVQTGGTLD
jgi:hypothetical protein